MPPCLRLDFGYMKNIIFTFFAFTLSFAAVAGTPKLAYGKAQGYTGLKKSLLYQALGVRKVYRRLA